MRSKKGLAAFASVALVCALAIPTAAFADTMFRIDGGYYVTGEVVESEDGTWSYDGDSTLTLNNYTGGSIEINDARVMPAPIGAESTEASEDETVDTTGAAAEKATFNVVLKGTNAVSTNMSYPALKASGVNLNITSEDESAALNLTTNSAASEDDSGMECMSFGSLVLENGNLSIINSVVNAIWNTNSTYGSTEYEEFDNVDGAITAFGGDITITNSKVTAIVNATENIINSWADTNFKFAGIFSTDEYGYDGEGGNITIDNSTVTASSPDFSIIALKTVHSAEEAAGTITLKNSDIVDPENGKIVSIEADDDQFYGNEEIEILPTATRSYYAGQTIAEAEAEGVITNIDDGAIASATTIAAADEPADDPAEEKASEKESEAAGTAVPKTADSAPVALLGMMLLAGLGCVALSRRQRA